MCHVYEFIPITNGEVHDLYAGRNNKHMYMVKACKRTTRYFMFEWSSNGYLSDSNA